MKKANARVVGMVGRDHPSTSTKAAETVNKRKPTIRQQVEQFFRERPFGATDSVLWEHFRFDPKTGKERPESSFRKRRSELAEENILIAHGDEAKNHNGQDAKVWRHREHCLFPPPIKPREAKPSRFDALQQRIAVLESALRQAIKVAGEAREEWDAAPSGMRAGKLLIALSGGCPRYRADIDAIHAAVS